MVPRAVVSRAPGRVNLIGEHTDYNEGFVLPMALPFETTVSAQARTDRNACLTSVGYGESCFSLDDSFPDIEPWARYVAGMARFLEEDGLALPGFDATISTTIPVGASLSSSAALEVAAGFALMALAGEDPEPVRVAQLGQRVENEIIGIQSGIMDQLISAIAVEGQATLIDCRSLETRTANLPATTTVVIMDTMTRRELAESQYDDRRRSCERAAAALGLESLRDTTLAGVEALVDGVDKRRARHVVTENARVMAAVDAMNAGDAPLLGDLMNESHRSLSEDYEVSSVALDTIAARAREQPSCLGARMTGGGFAGCAVALVERSGLDDFLAEVRTAYQEAQGVAPDLWAVDPSAGARVAVTT